MLINTFRVERTPMWGKPAAKPEWEGQQLTINIAQFGALTTTDAVNLAIWLLAAVGQVDMTSLTEYIAEAKAELDKS